MSGLILADGRVLLDVFDVVVDVYILACVADGVWMVVVYWVGFRMGCGVSVSLVVKAFFDYVLMAIEQGCGRSAWFIVEVCLYVKWIWVVLIWFSVDRCWIFGEVFGLVFCSTIEVLVLGWFVCEFCGLGFKLWVLLCVNAWFWSGGIGCCGRSVYGRVYVWDFGGVCVVGVVFVCLLFGLVVCSCICLGGFVFLCGGFGWGVFVRKL